MEARPVEPSDHPLHETADGVAAQEARDEADANATLRTPPVSDVGRLVEQCRAGAGEELGLLELEGAVVEAVIGEVEALLADLLHGIGQPRALGDEAVEPLLVARARRRDLGLVHGDYRQQGRELDLDPVIRRDFEGLAVACRRRLYTALLEESVAEVGLGLGVAGIDGDGSLVGLNCLVVAGLLGEDGAQVVVSASATGVEVQHLAVAGFGLRVIARFQERRAEIEDRLEEIRAVTQRGAVALGRAGEVALNSQGVAESVMRLGQRGRHRQGLADERDRLFGRPRLHQGLAEVDERPRMAGRERESLAVARNRIPRSRGGAQGVGQVVVAVGPVGTQGDERFVMWQRRIRPALGHMQVAQVVEGAGVVGIERARPLVARAGRGEVTCLAVGFAEAQVIGGRIPPDTHRPPDEADGRRRVARLEGHEAEAVQRLGMARIDGEHRLVLGGGFAETARAMVGDGLLEGGGERLRIGAGRKRARPGA